MSQDRVLYLVGVGDVIPPSIMDKLNSEFAVSRFDDCDELFSQRSNDVQIIVLGVSDASLSKLMMSLPKLKETFLNASIIGVGEFINSDIFGELIRIGMDDYLNQNHAEDLGFRVYVQKARKKQSKRPVQIANVVVDPNSRSIRSLDTDALKYLSPIETDLLLTLINSMGQAITREEVKKICWGKKAVSDNALNRKLFEIRNILNQVNAKLIIKTIYGSGFSIQSTDSSAVAGLN